MPTTSLNSQLVEQIIGHIRDGSLRPGERVTERGLAGRLRVSRSPVRRALAILRDRGVIEMDEDGAVIGTVLSLADARPSEPDGDEGIYFQIADDRLNGLLSDRVTENALLRRYALTRPRLTHILRRMSEEGWIERLPGHGWQFLPVLTSLDGYQDSYRFRLLIEPAAILEPGFVVDEPALGRVRQQQQQLVNGAIFEVSDVRLFELNCAVHQTIMACSGNPFFIESLSRVDRLRRLIDYRQMLDRKTARKRCMEHIHLIDLLLAGRREEASAFLHRHLSALPGLKDRARSSRLEIAAGDETGAPVQERPANKGRK